jgi:hypothetical protein
VAVGARAAERVEAERSAATELHVRIADAGVDDVDRHTRPGLLIHVGAVERNGSLIYPIQSPRRARLHGGVGRDDDVRLDERDLRIPLQRGRGLIGELGRESAERRRIREADLPAVLLDQLLSNPWNVPYIVAELYDVLAQDGPAGLQPCGEGRRRDLGWGDGMLGPGAGQEQDGRAEEADGGSDAVSE